MECKKYLFLVSCLLFGGGGLTTVSAQSDFNPENPDEPGVIEYCRVTVSADPAEGADVSGGGRYIVNGNSIYISTNARNDENFRYDFLYWTLNGEQTSYSQSFTFTPVKGRFEFVAHYQKVEIPFEPENPAEPSASNIKRKFYLYLTSSIEGACSFSMTSGNKVEEESWQSVTVYPNEGYQFDGWKINGVTVSTDRTYGFTMPSAHTTLQACFTELPFDPDSPTEPTGDNGNVETATRQLINLTIGTTDTPVDKTRIVINETMTTGYDSGTDAAKMISTDADYQIYSMDAQNVQYSINERPLDDGIIPLGIVVKAAGTIAIAATRMDCSAYLVDTKAKCWHDLSTKKYTFTSATGTFDNRFYIKIGTPPDIKGDVNGDGRITAQDASLILQAIAGKITLTTKQRDIANVNGDSGITAQDASLILQFIAGKTTW